MVLEAPPPEAALALARKAARALGLRVAAVDMFSNISGDPDAMRIIEVNSNPSIRLLEESGRGDLILKIWHHTFSAMGLLGV
jgi:glutathione synthase/RimK-type ligase-like ATP-grasp enzyme